MSRAEAALTQAVELSRLLLAAADRGDGAEVSRLDGERRRLLQSARGDRAVDDAESALLREVALLNDQSIGHLEHHRRIKQRQLETAAVGRQAVRAYNNGGRRR